MKFVGKVIPLRTIQHYSKLFRMTGKLKHNVFNPFIPSAHSNDESMFDRKSMKHHVILFYYFNSETSQLSSIMFLLDFYFYYFNN